MTGPSNPSAAPPRGHEPGSAPLAALQKQGASGPKFCRAYSAWVDALMVRLAKQAAGGDPPILAVGGYGRQELSPASDIDLLFLADDDRAAEGWVEPILHGLWNRGFQVGYATRGIAASVELAMEDLPTATSLLTVRAVVGDPHKPDELARVLWHRLTGPKRNAILEQLAADMSRRHARYGRTVYRLEPNIKHGPGGLRDLNVALWAAILRFRAESWADFLPLGVGSTTEARALEEARSFLLRIRNALHLIAPHSGDRLTFERQEAVAAALGFGTDRTAVERFLAAYYARASVVQERTRLIVERCLELSRPRPPATVQVVDEYFEIFNGQLTVGGSSRFVRDPRQAMRLFSLARERGVPIHGHAKERVMEVVPRLLGRGGHRWRRDPIVAQCFLDVITAPIDLQDALGDLHGTGLLGAMLPEFQAITHRTHHDLYHVYTVDIHTLNALRALKAAHRGEADETSHVSGPLADAMASIAQPLSLYLAVLLHDVGKATGPGHAAHGARLVPIVAARLGLASSVAIETEWLVRNHLMMAHVSQRRDLSDDRLMEQLAHKVGSLETLAKLLMLTWADALTTGPQAHTDWKAALLLELYLRMRECLERGAKSRPGPARKRIELRDQVQKWLEDQSDDPNNITPDELDRFFADLPPAYFHRIGPRGIARDTVLLRRARAGAAASIQVSARLPRGYAVLAVVAADRPGLLAILTGVIAAHRLDIVSADVYNTADGFALDVFRVREVTGGAPSDDTQAWTRFERDLQAVLEGETDVDQLLAPLTRVRTGPRSPRPAIHESATLDRGASDRYTVVEVQTRDRVGLLYAITRALAKLEISIVLARVTTEGDAAHDTFYLSDEHDQPLDDDRAKAVVPALLDAVRSPV